MANPGVAVTVRDGGLAIVPPGAGGFFAKIGTSPLGVVNSVVSVADQTTLVKTLGMGGSLVESSALALVVGGQGPVRPNGLLLVPVNPSTYGTATAVSHVGPGTGTVVVATRPPIGYQIKCITGGTVGVAAFQTSIDGGVTYGSTWTTAATVIVPGVPFHTLAFGAGTAVTGDVITISPTTGAGTLTSGSGTLAVTHSAASPVDAYTVTVTITVPGSLGVGMFTYSLDGGTTTSQPFLIPGSGLFVIPDGLDPNKVGNASTGLLLTFSGTFVALDTYSFITTSASYNTTDLTNAFNALIADSRMSSGVGIHVVGPPASSGAAATLLASLDVLMTSAAGSFKFNRAMMENPQDTDTNILAAFASSASNRVGVAPGFEFQISPINGRKQSRSAGWQVMARAGCVSPSEPLGKVITGSLPGVVSLVRDEGVTPGLDGGRFTTLTSIIGRNGFYITGAGRLMAQAGSDFTFWPYGRVIDLVSYYGRLAFLTFLNDTVRVNSDGSGTILEKDARKMEQYADQFIRAGVAGQITDLFVQVSRTNNVLSTQTILPTIRAIPLGIALFINVDIGFTNTALTVKAA